MSVAQLMGEKPAHHAVHAATQPTTAYRKKGARANLQKCMFCHRDKQKCEVTAGHQTCTKRKWPGQKCTRCTKYKYACSAKYTAKEELKCISCRENKEQCFPPDREWPGWRCDRCVYYGDACSIGLGAREDKLLRQQQRMREDGVVKTTENPRTTGEQDRATMNKSNDCVGDLTTAGSSPFTTQAASRHTISMTPQLHELDSSYQYASGSHSTERPFTTFGESDQRAILGNTVDIYETGYDFMPAFIEENITKKMDLHSALGPFQDLTYVFSERSSSQDTSSFSSPELTVERFPPADVQLDTLVALQDVNVMAVAKQMGPWIPSGGTECRSQCDGVVRPFIHSWI